MNRMLMVSVLAMVAAMGSASAGPVTADDLLKAQDKFQGMADLRARLSQLAL